MDGRAQEQGSARPLNLRKVDYCRYGFPYRKRTAIWTNTEWVPERPLCKKDCPAMEGNKHKAWEQQSSPGPRFTQRELHRIPPELCAEIAQYSDSLGRVPARVPRNGSWRAQHRSVSRPWPPYGDMGQFFHHILVIYAYTT